MLPVVHDRHPVAELVGLFHVVGGEQDRLARPRGARRGSPTARAGSAGRGRRWARRGTGRPAGGRSPGPPSAAAPCRRTARTPAPSPARSSRNCSSSSSARVCDAARPCRRSGRGSRGSPRRSATGRACSSAGRRRSAAWRAAGCATTSTPPTNALSRRRDDAGGEHAGRGRLAGAVRPEQAEDLAGGDTRGRGRRPPGCPRRGRPCQIHGTDDLVGFNHCPTRATRGVKRHGDPCPRYRRRAVATRAT